MQPLVENAIYHGFQETRKGNRIVISVYRQNDSLFIEVQDNGGGLEAAAPRKPSRDRDSIGLKNVQERLALL
ncbi:sensor histidine kinase [Paenibacillus sp. strain BS8-2]